jgi:hypothetical protein
MIIEESQSTCSKTPTWDVPGSMASCTGGRPTRSPGTPPPRMRNISTVCRGRTTSESPMISRVGICSADVARMTVTLQFDGDHFKVLSEGGQQAGEAALDRAYYAMQQHKRSAAAMALVVHVERTHN